MKLKFIGTMARIMGALPVARAQDMVKPGTGKIYLPDPQNDPLLVRGIGTKFESSEIQVGGTLVLPTVKGNAASAEVAEVLGPEEIRLKKGFRGADALRQLTGRDDIDNDGNFTGNGSSAVEKDFQGSSYKTAPKVDQTEVYNAVFDRLNHGGCVGIFPEGGSHDRTELLPLKGKRDLTHGLDVLTFVDSWCGHHGPWCFGRKSRLWTQDCPLWDELLSCSQIPIKGSDRVWHTAGSSI